MKIRQTDDDITKAAKWVARTRDFLEGEDIVKDKKTIYLPKNSADQPISSYKTMKDHTIFYPATSRTLEGLAGLMFRKPPICEGVVKGSVWETLLSAITHDGSDMLTFAYDVVCERLTSNFMGLLVDMPEGAFNANQTAEQLVDEDARPFINMYAFENIVSRRYQTIKGRKTLIYVRLKDADGSERELRLIDGEYWVQIWKNEEGQLVEKPAFQPLRRGVPLDRIPFFLNTRIVNGSIEQSPIAKVASLNLSHYRNEGQIAMTKLFQASPQGYVFGVEWPDGDDGKPFKPVVSPGTFWTNPEHEVKIGYLEYDGKGVDDMRIDREKLEELMSIVGARMIAGEKIAAEAPETLAIRRASENSALATIANLTSNEIQNALDEVAAWMGLPTITFQLNTDFLPQPMTAAELQAHIAAFQSGTMSHETLFLAMRDGDIISPTLDYKTERARILKDKADGLVFEKKATEASAIKDVPAEMPRNDSAAPLA